MMTAVEFVAHRADLPDAGRWTELVSGELKTMHPPDDKHGDIVLNLSKAVARNLSPASPAFPGFEIGVQTTRNPDTVRFPAMSLFSNGNQFAAIDSVVSREVPVLVVEIVATNDRRTTIAERVYEYHNVGVEKVWVLDPHSQAVTVLHRQRRPITFSGKERLTDIALLPDFEVATAELFAEPVWWRNKS